MYNGLYQFFTSLKVVFVNGYEIIKQEISFKIFDDMSNQPVWLLAKAVHRLRV